MRSANKKLLEKYFMVLESKRISFKRSKKQKLKSKRQQPKQSWKMKTKIGALTLPNFKPYHKTTLIKIVWYWYKDRYIDQWNKMENLEINPYSYGSLIFHDDAKTIQQGKNNLFSKWYLQNWITTCECTQTPTLTIHKN